MKKKNTLLVIGIALAITFSQQINAQEQSSYTGDKLSKHELKKLKKQEQKANDIADFKKAKDALLSGNWVLEANRIYFQKGTPIHTDDQTNFISLENNTAYLKFSYNLYPSFRETIHNNNYDIKAINSLVRVMGVGTTMKGIPTKVKLKEDKKGNIIYQTNIIGTIMKPNQTYTHTTINLVLTLNHESKTAEITFNSVFRFDNQLRIQGDLVPSNESIAYDGRMSF